MTAKAKAPEQWIGFLLTLIEYDVNFKPDWERFAADTGLYKRGKFAQAAYNALKKKHAAGQYALNPNDNGAGQGSSRASAPKTPGKKVTSSKPPAKRKSVANDDAADAGISEESDDGDVNHGRNDVKPMTGSRKKRKVEAKMTTSEDEDLENEDHANDANNGNDIEVSDQDKTESAEEDD